MGQPTRLRITLLLSVVLLAACTATLSAPPTALPPTLAAPPPTARAPAPSAAAPASLAATAAPTIPLSLAEQEIIADNRRTQHQQLMSTPQPPIRPIHPRLLRTLGLGGAVASVLSPDGRFLAVGTTAGWGVYTLPNLRQVRFEEIVQGVRTLLWRADGTIAAYLTSDGRIHMIDLARGTVEVRASFPYYTNPAFSPDGQTLAAVQASKVVALWRMNDPAFVRFGFDRGDTGNAVERFSIALDNQLLIAVRYNTIAFYRPSDGLEIGALPARGWTPGMDSEPYESVAISAAGDRLATISDGQILIWDISSR